MTPQVSGVGDRTFLVVITWLLTTAANKGWITTSDVAVLAPALALLPAYLLGWWKNRPQSIANTVAALGKDPSSPIQGLITTNNQAGRELAAATPGPVVSAGTPQAEQLAKAA